jgi:hypothetical protein
MAFMSLRWVLVCAASVAINLALVACGRGAFDQYLVVFLLVSFATAALCVGFLMRAPRVVSVGSKCPCTILGGRASRRATAQSGSDGASPSRNHAKPFSLLVIRPF